MCLLSLLETLIKLTININDKVGDSNLDRDDERILKPFASGSSAHLNPMAATFEGIVG